MRAVLHNTRAGMYNWTVGLLVAGQMPYVTAAVPLNHAAMIDTLLRVHGHEIFVDGFFNADPHPGNILLCPDGRLGLIDYGQVCVRVYTRVLQLVLFNARVFYRACTR